ncbi:MAG: NAD(P)-dependent alcohol dehydrogenase [Pseudomonadota bacterium]
MTTKVTAAVLHTRGEPLTLKSLALDEPGPGEVWVQIQATGICHTDIGVQEHHPLPAVLGHEGCGDVVRCGPDVTELAVGDRVVVTFDSCGTCRNCRDDQPAHCEEMASLNFSGVRRDGTTTLTDGSAAVHGSFFGQSSFATTALCTVRNAIPVKPNGDPTLLAPLGCSVQTGVGTVTNVLGAHRGSSIVCFGIGAVGACAIMAAVDVGCETVIAVDINPERLALASELGATHVSESNDSVVETIRTLTGGGADYAVETAGVKKTFHDAIACTRIGGHTALAAIPNWMEGFHFHAGDLAMGRTVTGVLEGSSVPHSFIPTLYQMIEQGRLPIDKLIKTYPFSDINQALDDLRTGRVVKPVLTMPALEESEIAGTGERT